MRMAALALVAVLAGCAARGGSKLDVKRIDGSTFEVTAHKVGSLAGAAPMQIENEKVAADFCAEKGKPMTVLDRRGFGGIAPQDTLVFRCGAAVPLPRVTPAKGA